MVKNQTDKKTDDRILGIGKYFFVLVIGLSIFIELISILNGDFHVIRIIIGSFLLFLIYQGYRWARILVGIMTALGGILGIVVVLLFFLKRAPLSLYLAYCLIIPLIFTLTILLFSKHTIAFLESRKHN